MKRTKELGKAPQFRLPYLIFRELHIAKQQGHSEHEIQDVEIMIVAYFTLAQHLQQGLMKTTENNTEVDLQVYMLRRDLL